MATRNSRLKGCFVMNAVPAEIFKEYVKSQSFTGTEEIMNAMKDMFSDVIQQVVESELETELGYQKSERTCNGEASAEQRNYRNGYLQKTVKTQFGEVDMKVPRDRNGKYEPQIIGKYRRNADGMEEKILALYSCGMNQRDIAEQIKNLYDVEISPELVSKISEKIMPEVTAWQNRPLEPVYPFVFLDAIHYKVKENHAYVTKAAYVVLGITMGIYPPEVRKIIYTTNIIEGLNRQFRQITNNKPSFTGDDSLRKMLYLASKRIQEHWTYRCRNWDLVVNQLNIMFHEAS